MKQRPEGRLGRGAEDGRRPIVPHQLADRMNTREEVARRQRLRLVEDDDALREVMELAAAGGAVPVERFKKLDGGRDDDRRVPVLGREELPPEQPFRFRVGLPFPFLPLFFLRIIGARMVFDDILRPQDFPEGFRRLVDDRGVGDDINHPLQPVGHCVIKGEGQRRHRLAPAGRDGQRKEAGRALLPHSDALPEDPAPLAV